MRLHTVEPKTRWTDKKRVGRGGKRGTTSGRGTKGQNARSGSKKIRPAIYDLIKKLPKLRGWKMKSILDKPFAIRLETVAARFEEGGRVTREALAEKKLVRRTGGSLPQIKILAGKPITKKLSFEGVTLSEGALRAVKEAGGSVAQGKK